MIALPLLRCKSPSSECHRIGPNDFVARQQLHFVFFLEYKNPRGFLLRHSECCERKGQNHEKENLNGAIHAIPKRSKGSDIKNQLHSN